MAKNAYLQHGIPGGPYRTEAVVSKETATVPRGGQTVSGYGGRVPTAYMVYWRRQWRRVYCMIYSNSGTLYIRTKDAESNGKIIVTIV